MDIEFLKIDVLLFSPILRYVTAFWSIGSSKTYLIGAVVLVFPPMILHTIHTY